MRHFHFTQSLELVYGGGLGTSALAMHCEMQAGGLTSALCATYGGVPQQTVKGALEFHRVTPRPLYFSPAMRHYAAQMIHDADVIHGHGLYVGTNFIFGREARRQSKPLVYHVHGMFEPYILQRSRWKKRLVHWLFEDDNFRQVRLWRALTTKEADQIRALGMRQPIVVAPNGLGLADFPKPHAVPDAIDTPFVPGLKKTGPRLLFLGRVHPKKGLDLLLPAWSRLGNAVRDWELVIAGPDDQGYLATVRELAQSLGLNVVFTGPVTGKTKTALLNSSDLFVLSSYSEGFCMSILEAMACELPIVATHACNFPEISSAQAGWECDETVDSVVKCLQTAIESSSAERRERGQNGRKLVESRYTWSGVIKTLEEACAANC